jgi:hypothetical protein
MSIALGFIIGLPLAALGLALTLGHWAIALEAIWRRKQCYPSPVPFAELPLAIGIMLVADACDRSGLLWEPGTFAALCDRKMFGVRLDLIFICVLLIFPGSFGSGPLLMALERVFEWHRRVALRRRRTARLRAQAGQRDLT